MTNDYDIDKIFVIFGLLYIVKIIRSFRQTLDDISKNSRIQRDYRGLLS